jgi:hypothetical protein
MTAIVTTLPASRRYESLRRILAVTRLHFVNKFQILGLPMIILGGIFLVNLAIWWIIIDSTGGPTPQNLAHIHLGYTGAVSYIFIYAMIIAIQAISRTFPFSLGFGVTRRDFYLGSVFAFVALSLGFAVVLTIMSVIEVATGGWGVGGRMFAPVYFTNPFWLLRFVMYFCTFLFVLFIGCAGATMFVRWRATGLTAFFGIITVILLAGIAYFSLDHQWSAVGAWFAASGPVGVTVWTLVPSAVAGVAGYFILRRATPKN